MTTAPNAKVVVITGASAGVGRATAIRCKGLMPAMASLVMHLFYAIAAALIYKHRLGALEGATTE